MMVWSPAPEEADAMVRKDDKLSDQIPMDLSGPPTMMGQRGT